MDRRKWIAFLKELKKVAFIVAPMVAVTVWQQFLLLVSVMMIGHLGELSLPSASLANSFANVISFCFLFGMCGALETLCGQAYGAEQYQKQSNIRNLKLIVTVPSSILSSFVFLYRSFGFSLRRYSSSLAKTLQFRMLPTNTHCLIPSLFPFAILEPLIRYFQTQSLILPMLFTSLSALCFHIPFCWTLVFKTGLGTVGAAISIGLSILLNAILLGFYMKYSSKCDRTRAPFSVQVLQANRIFFRFAVPSAAMVCLEWWAYEVLIFVSGLLPNPKLETSVLSICFTIINLYYFIPYGIGATASTRIANELGAGNPEAAKLAVCILILIAVVEAVTVSTILFFCRHILGYAYSSNKEVVNNVADMVPIMCLSIITDSLQVVLSGVARGCGRQNIAAFVNLGAFYLVGAPIGAVLAFVLHFKVKGLYIGLTSGAALQVIILGLVTLFTNWQKQASSARKRMLKEDAENETELTLTSENVLGSVG